MDVAIAPAPRHPSGWNPFAVRRTPSQWTSDGAFFLLALLIWGLYGFTPGVLTSVPEWFWPIDRALGLVAVLSIWWTRSHPLLVGILVVVPGTLAATSALAVLVAVYRMGAFARPTQSVAVTIGHVVLALPYHALLPVPGMDWVTWVITIPLLYAVVLGAGLLVRSRRLVLEGLRRTAESERLRLEAELARVRRSERERIAREMHDVLAHRISLLSVHAGALEYRTASGSRDLEPQEIHDAAALIRDTAHLAIDDLRDVLDVLRDERSDDHPLPTARRQPLLGDLPALAEEARRAGQRVTLEPAALQLTESRQRTVYRVVQEALTNARKHAPGVAVRVVVREQDRSALVRVSNPVAVGVTPSEIPGARSGLIGLAERVGVDGGTLEYGVRGDEFIVEARLPLSSRERR